MTSALWAEAVQAQRRLRRTPGVSVVAVLTLAVGIGATTAVFSVVDHVLLRPLAYRDARRLVALFRHETTRGERRDPTSPSDFGEWRRASRSIEQMTAAHPWSPVLTGRGAPEVLPALKTTPALFDLLGVEPALGRAFHEGGSGEEVVLSHALWARRFGGDPAIVGQPLILDGRAHVVSAVMPRGFEFPPFWATGAEMWVPLVFTEPQQRSHDGYLRVFGRLRPNATLAQARAEMDVVARRLAAEWPRTNAAADVTVEPLQEPVVSRARPALLVLAGAVGLVLLIACVNVATLLLAQELARERDTALRAALGASRGRLVRQWLVEAAVLALPGAVVGLLLARGGVALLPAVAPAGLPRLGEVEVDLRVAAFGAALAFATALLAGLLPALRGSRGDVAALLKAGERGATGRGRHRLHRALVVVELAMAVVLLVGAGLLGRSFLRLLHPDAGFRPEGLLTFTLSLSGSPQAERERRPAFLDALLETVRTVPDAESAAFVNHLPIGGDTWRLGVTVEGRPAADEADAPRAIVRTATAGYARTMGLPIVRGRALEDGDTATSEPVVLVNEAFARRHLEGGEAIGARIKLDRVEAETPWRRVVGIIRDARQASLVDPVQPEVVFPYGQDPVGWFKATTLVVRTSGGDPAATARTVEERLRAAAPELPVPRTRAMNEVLAEAISRQRWNALLLAALSAAALLLATVGTYAVMAYAVGRRSHEIGVRIALGARSERVLAMILGEGVRLAVWGTGLGALGALAASRAVRGLLHGVSPTDPFVFAGVAAVLFAVCVSASLLPALRAARLDPAAILKGG
jgi:putative ABC transport system permease protein